MADLKLVLQITADNHGAKAVLVDTEAALAQFARRESVRWQQLHRTELRDQQRFHRDKLHATDQLARQEAAAYEKHLGPGFFRGLASRASGAFKSAFNIGGAGGSGGGIGSLIGGVAGGNILASAITGTIGAVTGQVQNAIKTGFDFNRIKEQTLLGFEIKLKGRKEAEDFFEQVNKFAERAPQELDEVLDSTQKLMSAFSAPQALAALSAITDGVAATGKVGGDAKQQIDGIGLALQQMLFKGKVSGEEITQLAERQVKVYKYLGDEIAKTDQSFASLTDDERIARVQELGQKGLLNAKAAVAAILRGIQTEYGGTAERIAKETLAGIESNTSDRFSRLAGQATGNAFEQYKKLRQDFLDKLNSDAGETTAAAINKTTGDVLKSMNTAIDALRTGDLKGLGLSAITSAAEGVKQGAKSLYQEGTSAAGRLVDGIMDRLDMHSPSQVMIALGVQAGQSFVFGIQAGIRGGDFSAEVEKLIEDNAKRTGLPPELIRAVIRQESGGKKNRTSPVGAAGLMQLMPATARDLGVRDPYNAAENVRGGTDYLAGLLRQFEGRLDLALAAYNSGPGRVAKLGRVPRITETQNYVAAITADYQRQLQLTGASGGSIPRRRGVTSAEELAGLQRRDEREHGGLPVFVVNAAELMGLRARDFKEHGNGAELAGLQARDLREHGDTAELAGLRARDEREHSGATQNVNYLKVPQYDERNQLTGYQAIDPTKELPVIQHSLQSFLSLVPQVKVELKNVAREGTGAAQGAQAEADALAAAFGNLPPLINAAATEAKQAQKDFAQEAQQIASMFGDAFTDTFTQGPREGFKTLRREFASMVLGMARDWFESRIFKAITGTGGGAVGGGASGSSGGILSGLLGRLFGGGRTTAPYNPNASGGLPSSPLRSLAELVPGLGAAATGGTGTAGSAGLASGLGLSAASLAPLLPFLGLSLGAGLGKGSGAGSILGGLGGLLLGGSATALLAPSALIGGLGGGSLGFGAFALLTNPFTIGIGAALITGALLLGRNSAKRKNEQQRDAMATTLRNELYQLVQQVRGGGLDKQTAFNRYQDMRAAYVEQVAHFDGKTRAHAMKWLEEDLERQVLPLLTGAAAPNFLYNGGNVPASAVVGSRASSLPDVSGAVDVSALAARSLPVRASASGAAEQGESGAAGAGLKQIVGQLQTMQRMTVAAIERNTQALQPFTTALPHEVVIRGMDDSNAQRATADAVVEASASGHPVSRNLYEHLAPGG